MIRFTTFFISFALSLFATHATHGQEPSERPDSQFGAGLGAIYSANAIAGASDTMIVVPFFFYEGPDWFVRGPVAGYRAYRDSRVSVTLNARVDFQSWKPGDSPALAGMDRRKRTVELGGAVSYRIRPVVLNLAIWQDVFDRHGGWESTASLAYPQRISDRLMLSPRVELNLLSGSKANYHYGVRPHEATPDRPVYRPGRSFTAGVGVSGNYQINPNWGAQLDVALTFLSSDLRDSGIVDQRAIPRVMFGVLRLF